MCGIAALLTPGGRADAALVTAMGAAIRHRGPDGEATVVDGPVALFHARLAIIDLATGAQPMRDGALALTYNGEIYNYRELRRELETRGHAFRTTSDTEVILKAYREWGVDALTRFNGMFAFVLHDAERRRVVAARDRFGIKPLYWSRVGADVVWASEIKALLRHPALRAELDRDALQEYLAFQFVTGPRTLFRGIQKLEPASVQVVETDAGTLSERRYWSLSFEVREARGESEVAEELRALLEDAVALQVRSDVPLGAHLSGGLDSSLLATLAARHVAAPMAAFTGTFREGPEFDESPYARAVAARSGLVLHEVVPSAEGLPELLPAIIRQLDEPAAGPGVIPQFAVSRLAAGHVKVVLGGQGGDEVFGGYARYLVAYLEQALKGAVYETNEEAEHIVSLRSILANLPALQRYVPMLQRFWSTGVFDPMDRRYYRLIDRLGDGADLLAPALRAERDDEALFERFAAVFNRPDTKSYFNKMTHFDLEASLPALLQVEDRASMAASLESRVPLLDHRLVEFIASLPPRLKFRGGELKYILKRAIGSALPPEVLARKDKMGFPVPLHLWTRGPMRDFVRDTLLSERARQRGLTELRAVERLLDAEGAFGRQTWGLLCLELWCRAYLDE